MKKYTRTYIIQFILLLAFFVGSITGISSYAPEDKYLYVIVTAVVVALFGIVTINWVMMKNKNK